MKEKLYKFKRNIINFLRDKFSVDNEQTCILPDKLYIKLKYKKRMGKKLNIRKPKTYNEKLQWLKLYNRQPEYIKMVDKYEAKKYVASMIGGDYIIPTLGVWDRFEDIDFSSLPNQFVLKCTHVSGGVVICKDKQMFDLDKAKEVLSKYMKINYYLHTREWPYKYVRPRIIAEEYIGTDDDLKDYKFYCFNGIAKALLVASDRETGNTKFDYYDENFQHLPIVWGGSNSEKSFQKPDCFGKMKELSEKLSVNIPAVRVDLYNIGCKVYFGEITFFDGSGMTPFTTEEWDLIFGNWILLPKKKRR